MTITKPAPWPYDPLLTRLPAISALLGAAYPMWEGSGTTIRDVVSGTDITISDEIPAGSGSQPPALAAINYVDDESNPSYTSLADAGFPGDMISLGVGGEAKAVFWWGVFVGLTQGEAEYVTNPATQYALLQPDGQDYSVKPAQYAWTSAGLNATAQAIIAKCKVLAPCWEGSGGMHDLISGANCRDGFTQWTTVDGVAAILLDTINAGQAGFDCAPGGVWVPDGSFPVTFIACRSGMTPAGGNVFQLGIERLRVIFGDYGDTKFVNASFSAGGTSGEPSVGVQWNNPFNYGPGPHTIAISASARGTTTPVWAVDGNPAQLPPSVLITDNGSNPSFTKIQQNIFDNIGLGNRSSGAYDLGSPMLLFAIFRPNLTQAEAELITDPATRYILICANGEDYSVKPAPWAWSAGATDPLVAGILAKCLFLAPLWEGSGDTYDLIGGGPGNVGAWVTVGGVVGVAGPSQDSGASWYGANAPDLVDVPLSHLWVWHCGDDHNYWNSHSGPTDVGFQLVQTERGSSASFVDPSDPDGPAVGCSLRQIHDYGTGTHSFLTSFLARRAPGAWAVDGGPTLPAYIPGTPLLPPNVEWTTVNELIGVRPPPSGAYPVDVMGTLAGARVGADSALRFGMKMILSGLTADARDGWPQLWDPWSSVDGNHRLWIAVGGYDPGDPIVLEVECGTPLGEYVQFNFNVPEWVFDGGVHTWHILRTAWATCRAWVDGVELEHATAIEVIPSEAPGPPEDVSAIPFDVLQLLWRRSDAPDLVCHSYEGYPAAALPTEAQILADAADPFGAVAPAVEAAASRPTGGRNARRLVLQLLS